MMTPLLLLLSVSPALAEPGAVETEAVLETTGELTEMDDSIEPEEQEEEEEELPYTVTEVRFGRDLYVQSDIMLKGMSATHVQGFSTPRSWELVEDPEIRIRFEHSAALIMGRSSLTVSINDEAVASIMLDEDNRVDGEVSARIPRRLLKDYNQIGLDVVQHVNQSCEDPFDPALWTRVGLDSMLVFSHEWVEVEGELLDFPYPFFDSQGYGPLKLALAGGQSTSQGQLDGLAAIGMALGRLAAYRQVEMQLPVEALADADTAVLVLGSPSENPLVSRFVDPAELVAGEGYVGSFSNPDHPELPVLVVTGGDTAGVLLAAQAVSSQDRYQLLSGEFTRISEIGDPSPPPSKRNPMPVPADEVFTLAELGLGDRTIRGFYASPMEIPLKMSGDAKVRIDGARFVVDYGYAANLDTRLSSLEIRLNGVTLRSVPLDEEEGEVKAQLEVELPHELIEPSSELEVVFHLFPDEFDPCSYIGDRHIWGTVFDTSLLELERDYYAMIPDLALLRHDLWPIADAATSEELVVVLSDEPAAMEVTAGVQLIAELGRVSTGDSAEVSLLRSRSGLLSEYATDHVVVLKGENSHSTFQSLQSSGHITTIPGLVSQLSNSDQKLFSATVGTPYGSIEQTIHPHNEQRTVLVFQGPTNLGLLSTLGVLRDSTRLLRLSGNAAIISQDGHVRSLDVADQVQIGTIPLMSRIQTFLRSSWPILGLGVILAAILLTALIRKWAARRGGQA